MSSAIQILDNHSANQIAAGEVVERPVSVVKELVENSLDAGASRIEITVEGSGVPLIRIRDNGSGIHPNELPIALLRHATSKIRNIEDLDNLATLGFRGEALPSIASVSKLKISSRPNAKIGGVQFEVSGGKRIGLTDLGCPVGTTVTVEDLFFNTPARLKFLKSDNTEFGLIADIVGRLAIARPDVAFSLRRSNRQILQTSGNANLLEAIGCIYGNTMAKQLIPIAFKEDSLSMDGYLSLPDLTRSSRQNQVFIINGRVIRSTFLSRNLEQGYHTLIPTKTYPIGIIRLKLHPSEYDVNVHPTKMDIRFKAEQKIAELITERVREQLLNQRLIKSFNLAEPTKPISDFYLKETPSDNFTPPKNSTIENITDYGIASSLTNTGIDSNDEKSHSIGPKGSNFINPTDSINSIEDPLKSIQIHQTRLFEQDPKDKAETSHNDFLLTLNPIGQIFNSYILATDGDVLVIIDQHAAHERINYEHKFSQFKNAVKTSQQLIVPITIEFSPHEEQIVLDHMWNLSKLGYILEHFGDKTYLLRGIPHTTSVSEAEELLRAYLSIVLEKNTPPALEELIEDWIYLLACRESLKANETLTQLEMAQLLVRLSKTQNPFTCPHGRPVMTYLNRSDIEKRFLRK